MCELAKKEKSNNKKMDYFGLHTCGLELFNQNNINEQLIFL